MLKDVDNEYDDRIVYVITDVENNELYATFSKRNAVGAMEDAEEAGSDVRLVKGVLDMDKAVTEARDKLNPLEFLCLDTKFEDPDEDTIVYLLLSKGGGVDGRDVSDKSGVMRHALLNKKDAQSTCGDFNRIVPTVVVPSEVTGTAFSKLTPSERLCICGEYDRPDFRELVPSVRGMRP